MSNLVECLGYCVFILEFYIAFDIILICLFTVKDGDQTDVNLQYEFLLD